MDAPCILYMYNNYVHLYMMCMDVLVVVVCVHYVPLMALCVHACGDKVIVSLYIIYTCVNPMNMLRASPSCCVPIFVS